MKLQANEHGAWRTVSPFVADDSPLDALLKLAPAAPKLRVLNDCGVVLWFWTADKGWHRPHWYGRDQQEQTA